MTNLATWQSDPETVAAIARLGHSSLYTVDTITRQTPLYNSWMQHAFLAVFWNTNQWNPYKSQPAKQMSQELGCLKITMMHQLQSEAACQTRWEHHHS